MAMSYREREALKHLAVHGPDAAVRQEGNRWAARLALPWLASLPLAAMREALVGIPLWARHKEHGGDDPLRDYLARWCWWIEPTGRCPSPERKNALRAFLKAPARPVNHFSY